MAGWTNDGVSDFIDIGVASETLTQLPVDFNNGSVVLYRGEIHILGGEIGYYHRKWTGSSWVEVSTLPFDFEDGAAVVWNDEIHIIGGIGDDGASQKHYKWNGSSWSNVSTLPYSIIRGKAVVYNNEIHILGSSIDITGFSYSKNHYRWTGTGWLSVSTLPFKFNSGNAVVYNNEIHIMGGDGDDTAYNKHYKWNGSSWSSVSTLPTSTYGGASACVVGSDIHLIGDGRGSKRHYKWNGSSWSSVSTLPYKFYYGCCICKNDILYIIGNYGYYESGYGKAFYAYVESSWCTSYNINKGTLPYDFVDGATVFYNGELHILGGLNNARKHYKWTGTEWVSVSTLPFDIFNGGAVVTHYYDVSQDETVECLWIFTTNTSSTSYTAYVRYFNGSSWIENSSPLPVFFRHGDKAVELINPNGVSELHVIGGQNSSNYYHYRCLEPTPGESIGWEVLPFNLGFDPYKSVIMTNRPDGDGGYFIDVIRGDAPAHSDIIYTWIWSWESWTSLYEGEIPYDFSYGSAIYIPEEGKFHLFGGGSNESSASNKYHYTWDLLNFVKLDDLPTNLYKGAAVLLNGEICVIGNSQKFYKISKHYPKIIDAWTREVRAQAGSSFVYKAKKAIRAWIGNAQGKAKLILTKRPYAFQETDSNPDIFITGSDSSTRRYSYIFTYLGDLYGIHQSYNQGEQESIIYRFRNNRWISSYIPDLPTEYNQGCMLEVNGVLHYMSIYELDYQGGFIGLKHYIYDEDSSTWIAKNDFPISDVTIVSGVFKKELYVIVVGPSETNSGKLYKWNKDNDTWTELSRSPYRYTDSNHWRGLPHRDSLIEYNDKLYLFWYDAPIAGTTSLMLEYATYDKYTNTWSQETQIGYVGIYDSSKVISYLETKVINVSGYLMILGYGGDILYDLGLNSWIDINYTEAYLDGVCCGRGDVTCATSYNGELHILRKNNSDVVIHEKLKLYFSKPTLTNNEEEEELITEETAEGGTVTEEPLGG